MHVPVPKSRQRGGKNNNLKWLSSFSFSSFCSPHLMYRWLCKWGEDRARTMPVPNMLQIVFAWNSQPWHCTFKRLWSRGLSMVSQGSPRRELPEDDSSSLKTVNYECPACRAPLPAAALLFCSPWRLLTLLRAVLAPVSEPHGSLHSLQSWGSPWRSAGLSPLQTDGVHWPEVWLQPKHDQWSKET